MCSRPSARRRSPAVSMQLKRGSGIRLDMTPMVDVAFLLLIFFMSTTTLRAQEEDMVTLPATKSGEELPVAGQVVVRIDKSGNVFFSPGSAKTAPIALEELGPRVKEALDAAEEPQLLVFADGEVPYGTMTEVLRKLQGSEVYRMSLVTDVEEEG